MRKMDSNVVETIHCGVTYRANRRFREGRFENPYGNPAYAETSLKKGMAMLYQEEMEMLLKGNVCPCCGQFSMQDFDW